MKKLIYFLSIFLSVIGAQAQPDKIHYQGNLRNSNGSPLQNRGIRVRLSVLDSITSGSVLFSETQTTTTNAGGQFTVYLGGGTALGNPFSAIPWENGNKKYLKMEIDPNGGSNYQHFGTTLLVSVPYVIHAKSASEIKEGAIIRGNNGETYQISIGSNGPVWNCNPPVTQASAGSDQLNLPGIIFNLSGNSPGTGNTGIWSKISGNTGILDSSTSYNSSFIRGNDSIYTLEWKIQGGCGTSRDTVLLKFANLIENGSCLGETQLTYSGTSYPIVRIGNACWMAKNLNVGNQVNGSIGQLNNGVIEKFCYNDLASNCSTYGGMYQWAEAVQYQNGASNTLSPSPSFSSKLQGICPTGWHLPNLQDWCNLISYYDATHACGTSGAYFNYIGGALKSLNNWNSPNGGATNRSGFSAVSNGYFYLGNYSGLGNDAGFWSTQDQGNLATYFWMDYQISGIGIEQGDKVVGNAVRCVKDTLCAPTSSSAGPDQLSLSGTTATLAANSPAAGETGAWSIVTGSGGSLNSSNNPTATFTKGTDSAYTLVWTITGPCGTSRDTVNLRFPAPVGTVCGQAVSYAGESYPTVQIGTQCWFAKNLNVGTMIYVNFNQTNNNIIEKYCWNNDTLNCATYGGLYQWAEVVQYQNGASNTSSPSPAFTGNVRAICPVGWCLPSNADWAALENELGGVNSAGIALKATNYRGNNSSGFNALLSGYRIPTGSADLGNSTSFWTSTEIAPTATMNRYLDYWSSYTSIGNGLKTTGNPVRCIKDNLCTPTPSNAGPDQLYLLGTTTTLAGNSPPAGETGNWTIISGNGGSLSSNTNPAATFTKGTDSAYTLVWTITGPCGSRRDTLNITFHNVIMNVSCPGDSLVVHLGEVYPTVQIGTQCWLTKNMNVGNMVNVANNQTNNSIVEKYCFNNDPANCSIYGGLYQWGEAVQYQNGANNTTSPSPIFSSHVKGICPNGWHLPSNEDFCKLSVYLDPLSNCGGSFTLGGALKSTSGLWNSPNKGATNITGFSGIPSGGRALQGGFAGLGLVSEFWTTTEGNYSGLPTSAGAIIRSVSYSEASFDYGPGDKGQGFSVRCVKDTLCAPTSSSAGSDQLSLSGTTATLAANAPAAGETGAWSIVTGSGGSLSSASSRTATFTKGTDSAYTLVWTITGPCGTSRDTVNLRFPAPVGTTCGQTVIYAGESYPTVKIGPQCWLAKNLNVGTMKNSTAAVDSQRNNGLIEKYCYNNDPANCTTYGGLYQWAEAVQYQNGASSTTSPNPIFSENVQGICPSGWHLPLEYEWTALETYLGNPVGGALKSTSNLWTSNTGATNSSGFSALPSGTRYHNGTFGGQGIETSFWSSSEINPNINGTIRKLINSFSSIFVGYSIKNYGNPVRCIKDSICSPTKASAGPDLLNLSGASVNIVANSLGIGETGKWNVIAGSGVPDNPFNSPNITFNKAADNAYTLVWIISGACGISRDTMNISFGTSSSNNPCTGANTISYLGEEYASVMIGTQCWLGRNLNVGTRVDGLNNQTNNGITEKYCHNNDPNNCSTYGGMYQWAEAINYQNGATNLTSPNPALPNKVRGICPTGWHLPTDGEFCTFSKFLDASSNCTAIGTTSSTLAGGAMKAVSNLWFAPNTGANNSSGFSGLPGGNRLPTGIFTGNEKLNGMFWTSTETDFSNVSAFSRSLEWNSSSLIRGASGKEYGFAVRCIKDTVCAPTSSFAGPDQLNLSGTTATLAANAPASGETGTWSIILGRVGSFSATNNRAATFTRGVDSFYTLVWTINGPCGNSRDTLNLYFPPQVVAACGQDFPYFGEVYPTIQIGTQCWFTKNLNVGSMINAGDQTNNSTLEKYCYNNDPANCTIYGGLYQWAEAVQYQNGASNTTSPTPSFTGNVRGICPMGWHLPSDAEYCTLTTYLDATVNCGINAWSGTDAGGKMKSVSGLWISPNTGATNSSGFSALPSGFLGTGGSFGNIGYYTFFWSSSEESAAGASSRLLDNNNSNILRYGGNKNSGFSARCMKD